MQGHQAGGAGPGPPHGPCPVRGGDVWGGHVQGQQAAAGPGGQAFKMACVNTACYKTPTCTSFQVPTTAGTGSEVSSSCTIQLLIQCLIPHFHPPFSTQPICLIPRLQTSPSSPPARLRRRVWWLHRSLDPYNMSDSVISPYHTFESPMLPLQLYADYAVLDGDLTTSLPPKYKSLDTLSHRLRDP